MRRRIVLAVLALFVATVLGALWWVGQTAFVRFALDRAVQASAGRLSYSEVGGTLLDGVRVGRLEWREPQTGGDATAQGAAVVLTELRIAWSPVALLRRELDLTRLSVRHLRVELPPSSDEPATIPEALALPIGVRLRDASVDGLTIARGGEPPIELRDIALAARYRPGEYRIERLRVGSEFGELELNGTVGDAAPYPVLVGSRVSAQWRAVSASVLASGSVEEISVSAAASAPAGDAPPGFVDARLTLKPFDSEPLGPLELGLHDFDPATLGLAGVPRMRLSGTARAQVGLPRDDAGLRVTGEASLENALAGSLPDERIPVAAVSTPFEWRDGVLELARLRVELTGGGRVDGTAALDTARSVEIYGTSVPSLRAELALRDVDLSRFSAALGTTRLAGRARSDGKRLDFDLADRARGAVAISARLRVDDRSLAIERAELRAIPGLGEARLEVAGTVGLPAPYVASLQGRFSGVDPSKLPALLAQFAGKDAGKDSGKDSGKGAGKDSGKVAGKDAAGPAAASPARDAGPTAEPFDWLARLAGSVDGRWALQGPLAPADPRPRQIEFDLTEGTLAGLRARANLRMAFEPGRVQGLRADLALGETRAQANGALGGPTDALGVTLRVGSLAQIAKLLEVGASPGALAGVLRAEGSLRGSLLAPAVSLKVAGSDLTLPGGLGVRGIDLDIGIPGWTPDSPLELGARAKDIALGARSVRSAKLNVSGSLGAHVFRGEVLAAQASARFSGKGALAGERWRATLDEFVLGGTVPVQLDGSVSMVVAAGSVELGAARLSTPFGSVALRQASWREGRFAVSAQAAIERLRPLAELFGVAASDPQARRAIDEVGLDLKLDLAGSAPTDLTGTASAHLRAAPGVASAPAGGRADLTLSEGRLSGPLELDLPSLAFTERVVGPEWVFDGRLRFSGEAAGTLAKPRLVGMLRGDGLRLEQRALGWRLGEGTLKARFDGDTFEVQSLRLESLAKGGGSVEMRGQVKAEGLEGRFDFVAQRLVVPIGPGQRVVMSGDASVASTRGRFEIRGKLKADEGRIELAGGDVAALPDDVTIRQANGAQGEGEAAIASKRLRIDADLELDLGENLRIRGSGLDARLTGVVSLRGSLPGAPRAFGTVRVRDGRYTAYGQNLVITRGRVVFNGALDNPVLDIVALRRDQAVEAGVAVTGTVLDPRIRLTSIPDVPDAEKLSWLVLGVSLESGQTGEQGAALQAAALSMFGSRDGGMASGLKESLGLDVFTVRGSGGGSLLPSGFGESSPVPGQLGSFSKSPTGATATDNVFVIGKRLSKQVIVTYEQGLSGATSLVSIQYDFARRFSLRAQTGSGADGQSALDLIFRYPFD